MNEALWKELADIAAGISAFRVHYGPLKHYLPFPGVCLDIQPQAELDRLRAALEAASAFEGVPPRKYPFSAHMTIAEFITQEQTRTLMRELQGLTPEGDFLCDSVSYAVPDSRFHFTERAWLKLQPPAAPPC